MIDQDLKDKYLALAYDEANKWMRHETDKGGTMKGASYLHFTLENIKHLEGEPSAARVR